MKISILGLSKYIGKNEFCEGLKLGFCKSFVKFYWFLSDSSQNNVKKAPPDSFSAITKKTRIDRKAVPRVTNGGTFQDLSVQTLSFSGRFARFQADGQVFYVIELLSRDFGLIFGRKSPAFTRFGLLLGRPYLCSRAV